MADLIEAFVQNGEISYNNEQPEVPTTSEFRDGATYNYMGSKAVPASFEVSFKIQSSFEISGLSCRPYISISVPVALEDKPTSFLAVEDIAVKELVPMLRAIADAVEKQLAKVNDQSSEDTEAQA